MEVKKEKSSQDSDPSSKTPDSKAVSSEKVSQWTSILLGWGTILSFVLAPLTIVSYSNSIKAPFLLPAMFSTISLLNMFLFFLVSVFCTLLLPVFFGIYATTIFEEKWKAKFCAFCFGIPLAPVYHILVQFLLGSIQLPNFIDLLLLFLPAIIAAITSIVWLSFLKKKESSKENQSCPSARSPNDKKSYPLVLAAIVIALLTASQFFFSERYFQWMGYGDSVVEIVETDLKDRTKDAIKGCLLFNSGKEIYVRLNSSCSRQGQPSEWVIRFADKLGVDYLSQKDSGSIVRIPYKDIIDFEPDHANSTKAMPPPK
ncbi:hypothetical protein ABH19_02580 [Leptospirillum sp. Group II 'CF-1']|jgi:magnesium-transporting ATPase (P-type)|nr:hypothetical protein ABH19_02580 [Leptospirillum sp. Group II 'CF-1']